MIMAEIVDSNGKMVSVAGNGKANAGLTLGIIGTALGAIGTGIGGIKGLLGGSTTSTDSNLYLERKQCQDYLNITKQYYEGKIEGNERLTNAFFDAYKRDIDNSFALYKNQRDEDDKIWDELALSNVANEAKHNNLKDKIFEVDKKVDILMATRPYQDALINCKIDNNALIAAYELQKRTCRMIEGELVLPSSPTVTGYPSFTYSTYPVVSGSTF